MPSTERSVKANIGLTDAEAKRRLEKEGPNELPTGQERDLFKIILSVIREPMFILLIATGLLYVLLGDLQEALMLLGFVFVIIGITVYQEKKTEKALKALRDLSSPRAIVIRAGERKRIAGRDVVRGDFVVLNEGDRVPADAIVHEQTNLLVDESLLTGESVPVRKAPLEGAVCEKYTPGGDDLPCVFSGSMVVAGSGIAKVIRTGMGTELGKIGKSLQSIEGESTLLQKEVGKIVKYFTITGLSLCILVIVIYGVTRNDFLHGFLAGLTLAMAVLPEEFPVVLTVFFAIGAWRISKNNVLTRRVSAIEALGSAQVLCVDKTGTLTLNKMEVGVVSTGERDLFIDRNSKDCGLDGFCDVLRYGILASQVEPFDPMEKAIRALGERHLKGDPCMDPGLKLVKEYPLTRELLAISRVWEHSGKQRYTVAVKGAHEAIFDLCHLDKGTTATLNNKVHEIAGGGYRVIGVAWTEVPKGDVPKSMHDFEFKFAGFIGLSDPVRPGVKEAIAECYKAGMRVIMMTGDYPETAQHIARDIGLREPDRYLTGNDIESLSEEELTDKLRNISICARVVPDQKLRIVNAFKADKKVVAMTGDGVNDAPSLKAANIGIAMGGRGTDVARESAALVLLDDNFSSIVGAVRMGRRILDNLRKAMCFIISVHIPIAGLSFIPVFLNTPLVLLPVHILFLELMIDPACSIIYEAEPEEKGIMDRKPRKYGERMLTFRALGMSIAQGVIALSLVLGIYLAVYTTTGSGEEARALSFTSLVFVNLAIILANRSLDLPLYKRFGSNNTLLPYLLVAVIVFLGIVLYVPFVRELFSFDILHPFDVIICLTTGVVSLALFELLKQVHIVRPA